MVKMAYRRVIEEDPVEQVPVVERTTPVIEERRTSWTGYALVKYGFILLMTIVILWFIATYLLPLL